MVTASQVYFILTQYENFQKEIKSTNENLEELRIVQARLAVFRHTIENLLEIDFYKFINEHKIVKIANIKAN